MVCARITIAPDLSASSRGALPPFFVALALFRQDRYDEDAMELKYGDTTFSLHLPERHLRHVIQALPTLPAESPETIIDQALSSHAPFFATLRPDQRVIIITSDITRY